MSKLEVLRNVAGFLSGTLIVVGFILACCILVLLAQLELAALGWFSLIFVLNFFLWVAVEMYTMYLAERVRQKNNRW